MFKEEKGVFGVSESSKQVKFYWLIGNFVRGIGIFNISILLLISTTQGELIKLADRFLDNHPWFIYLSIGAIIVGQLIIYYSRLVNWWNRGGIN